MAKRGPRSPVGTQASASRRIRCAVYTRKSTEEGLEQAFNSLDAQREACEAYVASQRHEGWDLDVTSYDDGGFSGGNMERPALKRLLADVASDRIQVIVVYKVDRLTRALSDFAKIVEILDRHSASFVSVTQAFNTTTSMGRLTLNVLLSFAQFEREVTGERIRDKIAASKKKGMWMGGPVPLGYDVFERQLVINEAEAATVRWIFARHAELKSLPQLADEARRKGIRSKVRKLRDGRTTGGVVYSQGALAHILRSVIYIGRIPHGDNVYEGQHEALVALDAWESSQALLSGKRVNEPRTRKSLPSPLNGFLYDAHGRAMQAVHANRGARRYRYYVSREDQRVEPVWRMPAADVEALTVEKLQRQFGDIPAMLDILGPTFSTKVPIEDRVAPIVAEIADAAILPTVLDRLEAKVIVDEASLRIEFSRLALATMLGGEIEDNERGSVTSAVLLKRRGHELRLVHAAREDRPAARDDRLIQLLASGRQAWGKLRAGQANGPDRRELIRTARLSFLAPDVTMSILEGRQPVELTARSLLRVASLPLAWEDQRRVLGFS